MRKLLLATAVLGVAVSTAWTFSGAAQKDDDKKPKYTIKDVMAKAHKGKDALLTKYKEGKASKKDLEQLVEMYKALEVNKPPKGKDAEGKERTAALVKAANAAAEDKKRAKELLAKATNCAACHKAHKEDSK